jgi:hypothetical protein
MVTGHDLFQITGVPVQYGEIAMTYVKHLLYKVTEPAQHCVQCMLCQPYYTILLLKAALPHFVWHLYLHHLEENSNLA